MALIFNKKPIALSTKTLQGLLEKFSSYTEELTMNSSFEENYDSCLNAANLIKGSIATINQSREALQKLIDKLQRDYEEARKHSKKDAEYELEEIESQTNFHEWMAKANEMVFLLGARLTEANNYADKMARKLGITHNHSQTGTSSGETPQTGTSSGGEMPLTSLEGTPPRQSKSSDEVINPANAVWLTEDSSEDSKMSTDGKEMACQSLKLHQMKLPRFYGDEEEFPEFWGIFTTLVDQNKSLTTVEKMFFLKDSLRGRAELTVKGIQLIPQNYTWMTEELKRKYGNKPVNRTRIVQKLIDMAPSNGAAESCMAKYEKIRVLINQMVSAGQDIRNIEDAMWTEKILEKFPYHIVKNVLTSTQHNEKVTIENVMTELEKEITAKMFVDSRLRNRGKEYGRESPKPSKAQDFHHKVDVRRKTGRCIFCTKEHPGIQCKATDAHAKRKVIIARKLCWKCFADDHHSFDCTWSNCSICSQAHNTCLCVRTRDSNLPHRQNTASNNQSNNRRMSSQARYPQNTLRNRQNEPRGRPSQANTHTTELPQSNEISQRNDNSWSKEQFVLMTAEGNVYNHKKARFERVLFFFDSGAQKTIIEEQLAEELGLPKQSSDYCVMSGIGGHIERFQSTKVPIKIVTAYGKELDLLIQTKPVITNGFSSVRLLEQDKSFLEDKEICLCNSNLNGEHQTPQILVGTDFYYDLVSTKGIRLQLPSGLYITNTIFGPSIHGRGREYSKNNPNEIVSLSLVEEERELLQKMFELDGLGITKNEFQTDKVFEYLESYSKKISFENGVVTAPLPIKDNIIDLKDNYAVAIRRLASLVYSLKNNYQQRLWYCRILKEYEENDIIEKVPATTSETMKAYYMPHSGVWRAHKSKPLRIVFDASSKQKGNLSLNDVTYKGESLVNKILNILLASRVPKIILLCDIEAAFTQIRLVPDHKDLCRFLWVKDINGTPTKPNVVEYRFKRLPFGVTASPSILNMVILSYLSKESTPLAEEITKNLYVDNILLTANTVDEAIGKYKRSKQLFDKLGMNLREYVSNCSQVNEAIAEEDTTPLGEIKLLGLTYSTETDMFTVKTRFQQQTNLTKRIIVSQINSTYDPLGIVSPLLIKLKGLMREAYDTKADWNDILPLDLTRRWNGKCAEVNDASVSVPRLISHTSATESTELWVFGDASKLAIASCAYLHFPKIKHTSSILCGKVKLTPKATPQTIPRLELLSILISLRLTETILQELTTIKEIKIVSDSEIALYWLTSSRTLPRFVTNQKDRINKIKQQIEAKNIPVTFLHVSSEYNPADKGTRGLITSEINKSSWIQGPQWLNDDPQNWPLKKMNSFKEYSDNELLDMNGIKDETVLAPAVNETPATTDKLFNLQRFSKLSRLLRTVARVSKLLIKWTKATNDHRSTHLRLRIEDKFSNDDQIVAKDIAASEVIILAQEHEEMKVDELQKRFANQKVIRDQDGVIRYESRLQNAALPFDTKFPIFLPKDSEIARLIINNIHEQNAHCGNEHTLSLLRQRFWIPKPSLTVRKYLTKCVTCKKYTGLPYGAPQMPPLPGDRVVIAVAFENVGCDFMGPFLSAESEHMYVCLFTCLATRAIHLEVAENMSTGTFLNCFVRFISRRGVPKIVRTDCGTNFRLGQTLINNMYEVDESTGDSLMSYCATRKITWIFNPPASPWMGGVWERLVGSVKRAFQKAIGRRKLTFPQMCTTMAHIEAILNTRPLTKTSLTDLTEIPLRPVDFLRGNIKYSLPRNEIDSTDPNFDLEMIRTVAQAKEAYEFSENIATKFWERWNTEYLTCLRDNLRLHLKQKRHVPASNIPQIGEIVLLEQEMIPRGSWSYGKLTKINHSADGLTRSVEILMPNGKTLQRPMNKVYPLEIRSYPSEEETHEDTGPADSPRPPAQTPTPVENPEPNGSEKQNLRQPIRRESKTRAYDTIRRFEQSLEEPHSSGTSSTLVMLTMMLNLATTTFAVQANVSCKLGEVQIRPPQASYELCFDDQCRSFNTTEPQIFNLPRKPIEKPTIVLLKTLENGTTVSESRACEPPNFCDKSTLLLSKHLLGNPHCWPIGAIITVALIIYCIITTVMLSIWFCRKMNKKVRTTRPQTSFQQQMETHQQVRLLDSFTPRPLRTTITMCALLLLCSRDVDACQHGYMRRTAELVCTNEKVCSYEYDQEILLNHIDSKICIEIMHANKSVGLITVTKRYMKLKCAKISHYYTRETAYQIFHVTRCAQAGSCTLQKCNTLAPTEIIEEFNETIPYPGYSTCTPTCGGIQCGCLLPMPACAFMRLAHVPLTETAYEVVSCLDWEPIIELEIATKIQNLEKVENITLLPYTTHEMGKMSVTAITVQKPLYPMMEKRFALAKKEAFLVPDNYALPVQCASKNMATKNFANCTDHMICMCENPQAPHTCHCPDNAFAKLRFERSNHLPISTSLMEIRSEDMELYTYTHEGETTLAIKSSLMLDSASYIVIEPCKITAQKLIGCYECTEGSTLDVACFAQIETRVTIQCETQVFSIPCDKNNRTSNITMEFDHAVIHEKCHTLCGNTQQEFILEGTLHYHPDNTSNSVFDSIEPEIETNWSKLVNVPDLQPLMNIVKKHWRAALAAIGGISAMIGITYLFGPAALMLVARILWTIALAIAKVTWQALSLAITLLREAINTVRVIRQRIRGNQYSAGHPTADEEPDSNC